MTEIKITIDGDPYPIFYKEKDRDFINEDIISLILQRKSKITNEQQIEFIRYLHQKYDAWVLLKKNEDLTIRNGLEILVKLSTNNNCKEDGFLKQQEIMNRIKNLNKMIDNELSKFNKENSQKIEEIELSKSLNSSNINEKEELDEDSNDDNDLVDIIVLTANPLIDKKINIEEKVLRTMNDFNSITHSIWNVIKDECNKQIKAKFLPLTTNNLKIALSQRPKILHLICKSVYIVESESNKYKTYLFFEDKNCEVDRISKDDLEQIFIPNDPFKKNKDIINNITLFVSTPLSEDVFKMLNNFNFKNILVQHTTLANIDFITELNGQLYLNIIKLNKSTKDAFDIAKKNSLLITHQSCCCFHEHQDNCNLKKFLINELYSDIIVAVPFKKENEKGKCEEKEEYYFKIPHFYHLRYRCQNCYKNKGFCEHKIVCDNYSYCLKNLYSKKKAQDLCCCCTTKKHNLENIFFHDFSEKDKEGIFSNYQNNNFSSIIDSEFVPDYNKMKFIVGRNFIIYNIFDSLREETYNIINIYGEQYKESINKIDLLIDMIVEFLKERIPYNDEYFDDLSLNKNNFFKTSKEQIFVKEKYKSFGPNEDLKFKLFSAKSAKSVPYLNNKLSLIPEYQKICDQNHINTRISNDMEKNKNTVYFINGYKISNEELIKVFNHNKFHKIVLFTENIFTMEDSGKYKILTLKFNSLTKEDFEIKLQNKKIENNKRIFDSEIKKQLDNSFNEKAIDLTKSITIIKDPKKSDINYEILFLFKCSNSGLFLTELEALYPIKSPNNNRNNLPNYNEIISIIERKYMDKGIINKEEINEKVHRYIRNQISFEGYYNSRINNISNKSKELILQELFQFYANAFRFLLLKVAMDKNDIKLNVTKYKPNKSLTSFSAIQELGMWLPFEKNEKFQSFKLNVITIYGFFYHLLRNFKDTFKEVNIHLCSKNEEVWKTVRENIEDISITLLTLIKMFSLYESEISLITLFEQTLKMKEHFIHPSYLRFKLFRYMSYVYSNIKRDNINKLEEIENELEKIENEFKIIGYIEGELETLFAKCIVNYRKNEDLEKFDDIYKNKIMVKLFELKDSNYPIENKERFVTLFQCKVKYKYIKYKIKNGKLINDELLELQDVLKDFVKQGYYFYVIKSCFLISEWHLKKKESDEMDEDESKEELQKHIVYLNLANYVAITFDTNQRFINYEKDYIKKNYKNCVIKKDNPQMKETIIKLCKDYNIKILETKFKNLSFFDY